MRKKERGFSVGQVIPIRKKWGGVGRGEGEGAERLGAGGGAGGGGDESGNIDDNGYNSEVPGRRPVCSLPVGAKRDWPRLSFREQFKEEDEEVDRGNDGKTTSKSGLILNGTLCYGKLRTARSGGSWL